MLLDELTLFSDQQAITASAASTNHVDLGATATPPLGNALVRDIGGANDIPLLVQVTEAFDNLTSLRVDIQVDDNNSFSSAKVVGSSGEILLADLVAGKQMPMPVIPAGTNERYLRLFYTVTGTAPTAGKVTASVSAGNQTNG